MQTETISTRGKTGIVPVVFAFSIVLFIAGIIAWWFLRADRQTRPAHSSTASVASPPAIARNTTFTTPARTMEGVAFSADGKLLAVIGDGKTVYLLDVQSGKPVDIISDACCTVAGVDFSQDGNQLALAMNDGNGARVRLLRLQNGRYRSIVREVRQQGSLVHSVAFSHDGTHLLGEIDSDAILWHLDDGVEVQRFDAGVNGVCALSTDGQAVVTAGSNANEVKVWDIANNGFPRFTLTGHAEGLLSVAFSPDNITAASGGYDGSARLWNTRDGSLKRILNVANGDPVYALAFAHSGSSLATASDAVRVWDLAGGPPRQIFQAAHIGSLAYSSDDRLLAGTSSDGGLFVWQLR